MALVEHPPRSSPTRCCERPVSKKWWNGTKPLLNAEVLYRNDFLVFMTDDEEHHRIALAAIPRLVEKPKPSVGLDHLAFFYSNFSDWITTYKRLKAVGITPTVPIHHGWSMSLYYRNPDDNGVESSIDNVENGRVRAQAFRIDWEIRPGSITPHDRVRL